MACMQNATFSTIQPAIDLLLEYEVGGGEVYYNRYLLHPTQPTPGSGITIGIGYDLGQSTSGQFLDDWAGQLPERDLHRLRSGIGLSQQRAAALLSGLLDIAVPWVAALTVFRERTLPQLLVETRRFVPQLDVLPPYCQAALLSLVYNRGTGTRGNSRLEMREIQVAVSDGLLDHVPVLLRSMKRLWVGKPGGPGLIRRREAEALAFERGLHMVQSTTV